MGLLRTGDVSASVSGLLRSTFPVGRRAVCRGWPSADREQCAWPGQKSWIQNRLARSHDELISVSLAEAPVGAVSVGRARRGPWTL